jgi:hypothetical protein
MPNKNASKNFLQSRGYVALVTYKGYWIPATSEEYQLINKGQFEIEHTPLYEDHVTRRNGFRYMIHPASGGRTGYIRELATGKTRQVLIAIDPSKFKSVDF